MELLKNMYKFTSTDADISDSLAYQTLKLAESGEHKKFKENYKILSQQSFSAEDLKNGQYKLMRYILDFRPFLKKYLVCFKYENVYRIHYALNKSNIADNFYITKYQLKDVLEYKK